LERLKDKTNRFIAQLGQLSVIQTGDIGTGNAQRTGSWAIQAAQQVHQSRFA
jgi:hypothetical protein